MQHNCEICFERNYEVLKSFCSKKYKLWYKQEGIENGKSHTKFQRDESGISANTGIVNLK